MTPRIMLRADAVRRGYRLLFILFCITVTGTLQAADRQPLELIEMGFFEGDGGAAPPDWGSSDLAESFDRDQARYIFTVLNLKNNRWQIQGQDVRLLVRYFAPDGSLVGEPLIEYHVPADWEYTDLRTGWGWSTAGNWEAGSYRVEVHAENNGVTELIAEKKFSIQDTTPAVGLARGGVEFDRMGFFAGDDSKDAAPADWNDPRLRNRFAQATTGFVYTLVSLKNLQWQQQGQRVVIQLRYYRSNGELAGDPVIDYQLPAAWESARLSNGMGWTAVGNWKRDRYRVELWLDNRSKIGESHFEIY